MKKFLTLLMVLTAVSVFTAEEEKNGENLSKDLASLAEIYVNQRKPDSRDVALGSLHAGWYDRIRR